MQQTVLDVDVLKCLTQPGVTERNIKNWRYRCCTNGGDGDLHSGEDYLRSGGVGSRI